MIRDLTSQAQPLKNHSKFKGKGLSGQSFLRLRRAKRGFAFGSVLHSPKSATLAVAIIPVTPQEESLSQGRPDWCGPYTAWEDWRFPPWVHSGFWSTVAMRCPPGVWPTKGRALGGFETDFFFFLRDGRTPVCGMEKTFCSDLTQGAAGFCAHAIFFMLQAWSTRGWGQICHFT